MNDYNPAIDGDFRERFFDYHGRLNRKRYLVRVFSLVASSWVIAFIVAFIFSFIFDEAISQLLSIVFSFPCAISIILQHIRRFHDLGKSGYFILLFFIPFLGFFVLFYLFFAKGDDDDNEYGANPLDYDEEDDSEDDYDGQLPTT